MLFDIVGFTMPRDTPFGNEVPGTSAFQILGDVIPRPYTDHLRLVVGGRYGIRTDPYTEHY